MRPASLSKKVLGLLDGGQSAFLVSVMSQLEVRYLLETGKSRIGAGDVASFIHTHDQFNLVPVDESVVSHACDVETRDPFDRLIMATALAYDVPIITKDAWMTEKYPKRVVW
jgi:PIN domain nuclease of toxin-antitoxin system